jgi:hypothetical protein
MTKVERAIEALEALPADRQDEIADIVLELTQALNAPPGESALSADQLDEVRRRRASGFQRGDLTRLDELLARLG